MLIAVTVSSGHRSRNSLNPGTSLMIGIALLIVRASSSAPAFALP
jgi:hypothetical protein